MDGRTIASAEKRRLINFMLLVSEDDSAMEVNSRVQTKANVGDGRRSVGKFERCNIVLCEEG
jgi:hypothetical protein